MTETYWLIERDKTDGSGCEWWAGTFGKFYWVTDVEQIHPLLKFPSREAAQGEMNRIKHWDMNLGSKLRVTEHVDID